jgi:hypothetical protein
MPEPPKPKPPKRRGPPPVLKLQRGKPAKVTLEQGIQGEEASPSSAATLRCDEAHLYVNFDNQVDAKKPLKTGQLWGVNDAVEVAIRNPAAGKKAPILVLRGYTNGHFESSTEAGASPRQAKKAAEGVKYAAKIVANDRWTAEWQIPFASLGIDPRKHRRLQLNLTVRKTAAPLWLMWCGTGGYSWLVANAGIIELAQ